MANLEDAQGRSSTKPEDRPLRASWLRTRRQLERVALPLAFAVFLAFWEWQARAEAISSLFFPPPTQIWQALVDLTISGEMAVHLGATLSRMVLGSLLGGLPALALGLAMGWSLELRRLFDPLIAALHPIPKIAVLPLIMIIFGIGQFSKLMVVAIASFFPMLINTMAGVRQISPVHFEVAENLGASTFRTLTRVVLPGSLPMILTGSRLALNVGLLLTIAVELLSATEGLGVLIWFAWQTLRVEELYASLAVTALLGIGINLILETLKAVLVPWHVDRGS